MQLVADIEANGLDPDKIHCMVVEEVPFTGYDDMRAFFSDIEDSDYLIGHNFVRYDKPVLERLLNIKIKAKIIDTLALSWYLYPERNRHGLSDWGEEFGIPKPVIEDWDNLTPEEYLHRCKEDVKINTMLWDRMKAFLSDLYGEDGYWGLIEYLSFKMHCAALQEHNRWKLDVSGAEALLQELTEKQGEALESLQGVMPDVQAHRKVTRPAKPFKQDGTKSVTGDRWQAICDVHGIDFDSTEEHKIPNGFKPPKATSPIQIKDWLYSLGWVPQTFKYVDDGEDERGYTKKRTIPQVKNDNELCPSVLRLMASYPELRHLEDLGATGHRKGLVAGLLAACDDGYVTASIQGLANTLRFKHKTCVNLPSERKPYGKEIRGLLLATEGNELCGSDMSNLEGRVKEHYLYPIDPDYVEEVNKKGYDGHIQMAVQAELITEDEGEFYKWYKAQ